MKNQNIVNRIDSIIDGLKEIQLSNATVISKLEQIKGEILSIRRERQNTETEQKKVASANTQDAIPDQHRSPDTNRRNTGTTIPTQHTDNKGRPINFGNTVHILNMGLFKGNRGVKARISIRLASGRTSNQKITNLEVIPENV